MCENKSVQKYIIIISMLVTIIIGIAVIFGIKMYMMKNNSDNDEPYISQTVMSQQSTKEPEQEQINIPTKEPEQEQTNISTKEPEQEQINIATKEPVQELTKTPTQKPTSIPTKKPSDKPSDTSHKTTPFVQHGKLRVEGTNIVDKNGKIYRLKGASTHGIAWFGQYVNNEAFKSIRDMGANVIRLSMYTNEYNGYMSGGNKKELEQIIDNGVNYATELGMYVIIDWHILSDGNPNTYKEDAKKFFDKVSKKYKSNGNVLYEICNEPNNTSWDEIRSYANEVISVIRNNDKNAIIIVGTPTWSQEVDVAIDNPVQDEKNVMYAVHFYAATHKQWLRDKVEYAISKGVPVFLSEFSICDASGNGECDYYEGGQWMELADSNNLSCVMWSLCNKNEKSALISDKCDKLSDWTIEDLSETGKWWFENCLK